MSEKTLSFDEIRNLQWTDKTYHLTEIDYAIILYEKKDNDGSHEEYIYDNISYIRYSTDWIELTFDYANNFKIIMSRINKINSENIPKFSFYYIIYGWILKVKPIYEIVLIDRHIMPSILFNDKNPIDTLYIQHDREFDLFDYIKHRTRKLDTADQLIYYFAKNKFDRGKSNHNKLFYVHAYYKQINDKKVDTIDYCNDTEKISAKNNLIKTSDYILTSKSAKITYLINKEKNIYYYIIEYHNKNYFILDDNESMYSLNVDFFNEELKYIKNNHFKNMYKIDSNLRNILESLQFMNLPKQLTIQISNTVSQKNFQINISAKKHDTYNLYKFTIQNINYLYNQETNKLYILLNQYINMNSIDMNSMDNNQVMHMINFVQITFTYPILNLISENDSLYGILEKSDLHEYYINIIDGKFLITNRTDRIELSPNSIQKNPVIIRLKNKNMLYCSLGNINYFLYKKYENEKWKIIHILNKNQESNEIVDKYARSDRTIDSYYDPIKSTVEQYKFEYKILFDKLQELYSFVDSRILIDTDIRQIDSVTTTTTTTSIPAPVTTAPVTTTEWTPGYYLKQILGLS